MDICCKHSNDVVRRIETPGKSTIFVVRHDFFVALKISLYHDRNTRRCCIRYIFSFNTCDAATFLLIRLVYF